MGVGLVCGTFPAYVLRKITTEAEYIISDSQNQRSLGQFINKFHRKKTKELIEDTVIEELFFRGFIQGFILNRFPRFCLKKINISEEFIAHNIYAKTTRVFITSLLFSYAHLSNEDILPPDAIKRQIVGSFVGGLCLGCIKESPLGLAGATGGHIANNLFALA